MKGANKQGFRSVASGAEMGEVEATSSSSQVASWCLCMGLLQNEGIRNSVRAA